MERKEFLKRLGMSTVVLPLIGACSEDDVDPDTDSGSCVTYALGNRRSVSHERSDIDW